MSDRLVKLAATYSYDLLLLIAWIGDEETVACVARWSPL